MRKDIKIPEAKGVYMAALQTFNEAHRTHDWNAYLINASDVAIETVLIVSSGGDKNKKTSVMRHKLDALPAKSYAKVEFLEDSVLALNNTFQVTYFQNGTLFERKFTFPAESIKPENNTELPVIPEKGILAE